MAARVLGVANQKGGVGKSSTAIHIAHYAADQGQRVLVVDLDQQANTTGCFLQSRFCPLVASALFAPEAITALPTVISERIHIIPADAALRQVEKLPREVITLPREHLRRFDYDLIIIDTPPTLGNRLESALVAADAVLTPFTMEKFSLDGITDLIDTIQEIQALYNPALAHLGILTNKFNSRSAAQRNALAELRALIGDMVLPHVITERASISDALAAGLPVWSAKKGESGRLAAAELLGACADIYERLMK